MEAQEHPGAELELVEKKGPWPFVSHWTLRHADGSLHRRASRHHRKGLYRIEAALAGAGLSRCLWMPQQLNWWIAVIFAVGASLFMLGSVLVLAPALADSWSLSESSINVVFFAGSFPFTTAAYLQLYQAANAGPVHPSSPTPGRTWFGWQPSQIGWMSCALQFVGTLLFNVNTFDALLPDLDWLQQDLAIWGPDVLGSVLFLASGYLAFVETCHAHWSWQPKNLSWWVAFANLLGCIAFMISAVFAFVPSTSPSFDAVTISVTCTLLGAVGFLVGSLLMLPETARALSNSGPA